MSEFKNKIVQSLEAVKRSPSLQKVLQNKPLVISIVFITLVLLIWGFIHLLHGMKSKPEPVAKVPQENLVQLTAEQSKELKIGLVGEFQFHQIKEAVGVIDFDKHHTADVYSPYQGRINQFLVEAGKDVKKGQVLYTVLAPDVAQASSSLLSTAGQLKQANETLKRAKDLFEYKSISQKELEQNISDQQTAEANFLAAKKSMQLYGFSDEDIQDVVKNHKIDYELKVKSPISGRVISRTGSTGQLVQPGVAPAPATVSDLNELWMVAQVPESETSFYKLGQPLTVQVQAYPERKFPAKIVYVGDSIDPVTRRLTLYARIDNTAHDLKPQMLASFQIEITKPESFPALPPQALARESNGTQVVWKTTDGITFNRQVVKIGITQDGMVQVLEGLQIGDKIALNKALFLSNVYTLTH
jgi:membrane fusion protein, heavy metal efflux system